MAQGVVFTLVAQLDGRRFEASSVFRLLGGLEGVGATFNGVGG